MHPPAKRIAMSEKHFKLDTSRISNPILRVGAGLSRPLIERTLCFPGLNKIYAEVDAMGDDGRPFVERVLDAMDVSLDIHATSDAPFPAEGPVVVVANHPFGGIEGVLLIALMERYRKDTKVMANYILSAIPELREKFFFVDPFGGPNAKQANLHSMRGCLQWLKDGHVLCAFPAGEVSSIDLHSGKVRDPAWSPMIARLVRKTQATVVPLFFSGHNGAVFNMAGLIHPRLRTVLLPKQFVNKKSRVFHVEIGKPLPWDELDDYPTDEQLIQYLRLRSYILGERESAKAPKKRLLKLPRAEKKPKQAPLVDAVPSDELQAEIDTLPPEALLVRQDEMHVYCAAADAVPKCLHELGRLRELTFRAVGEGTNNEIDLDAYDSYYLHLFIWNTVKREIVGAYRLGLSDEILSRLGVKGLYTHTCFKFDARLIQALQPAVELGRSFIRTEYQRSFSPLMLLWKGLSAFLYHNPKYINLFGPVSISNDYLDTSRNLILRSLRFSNFAKDLARLVKPRCRPRRAKKAEWNLPDFNPYIDNIDLVSKMIQDIESDQKGIPVLLRQYLKMGGKIIAFNVDPAFNYCLDGLICVNVPMCDPRVIRRYMGAKEYEQYMEHHPEAKKALEEAAAKKAAEAQAKAESGAAK